MSAAPPPLQVVVVDDISRFACHVYQCLSENIGFGIGQVQDDGGKANPPFTPGKSLHTPAGDFAVWWVNAAGDWEQQLEGILDQIKSRQARFLVDVRGPLRPQNNYHVATVVSRLLTRGRHGHEILPVSSYRTGILKVGGEDKEIQPKTWKTLRTIARVVEEEKEERTELAGAHILVTGAGFERERRLGGCQGLGMPATSDILIEGWKRYDPEATYWKSSEGFPVPEGLGEDTALRQAARAQDLDTYWDEALKLILERHARSSLLDDPGQKKLASSRKEHEGREAFRHALLRDDWGQLNQALDAASLDWIAWLSTNYTGFADRALALTERELRSSRDAGGLRPWSIVSTSHEAVHLTRRLLHGLLPNDRFLFKLHGHIEHLLTMAIAGQDKEIYSTLSLPVDSLHEVYSAAELYLKRYLQEKSGRIFWHVVGHRMKDVLLQGMLQRVAGSTSNVQHSFLFIRPGDPREIKKDHLAHFSNWQVVPISCTADEYLARLRRRGMTESCGEDLGFWAYLLTNAQAT